MTKPVPDKAEVALEYPDKVYIGTFERTARFDAHLDETGISLTLRRDGSEEARKSVRMHFHYGLFSEILRELAAAVAASPLAETTDRNTFRDSAKELYRALSAGSPDDDDVSKLTPGEEVGLLHIME
jgi:hypothetical protein